MAKSNSAKDWNWLKRQRLTQDEIEDIALGAVTEGFTKQGSKVSELASDSVGLHVEGAKEVLANWGKMQGLSCGYPSIDRLTLGLVPGELAILGAYTSRGKTQFSLNMMWHLAKAGVPILFITLEMPKDYITARFMRLGNVYGDLPIYYQPEESEMTPEALAVLVPEMVKRHGIQMVVIDHLHYIVRGKDMKEQIGIATKIFKDIAKKNELSVFLLAQLSRPLNKRGRLPLPTLADLKESSYIEQDADVVLMIHRDLVDDDPDDKTIVENSVTVAMRKNRNRGMRPGRNQTYLWHDADNGVLLRERQGEVNPQPVLDIFPGAKVEE